MEYTKNKKIHIFVGVFLAGAAIFTAGIFLGYSNRPTIQRVVAVVNKESTTPVTTDFAPFWEVWNTINEKYPNASDISDQDKIWGATKGLVDSLGDPHSNFFDPEEHKAFEESINGEFSGIGIEIGQKDGILTVIAPLANTPAAKAGIRSGDLILKIGGVSTAELTLDEAIDLIRGDVGTSVILTILSENSEVAREVSVERQIIEVPTLSYEIDKNGIFVISLYNFSANSADLFEEAMKSFEKNSSKKLIIDVRGNPGGYLDSAVDISSWFIPEGQIVAIESYGEGIEDTIYRSHGYPFNKTGFETVILVDQGSASASEIFAGAMQEYNLATIIGEKTYGKGSVQELIPITSTTSLKLTVAKWLTPNRISLSDNGLDPDIRVSITVDDIENSNDIQMKKAIEFLK